MLKHAEKRGNYGKTVEKYLDHNVEEGTAEWYETLSKMENIEIVKPGRVKNQP